MSWFVSSAPGKYDERGRYPLDPELEEQFELLFEEPGVGKPARAAWEDAKKNYRGLAVPIGAPLALVEQALADYDAFALGRPIFYEHARRGILARFADNPIDVNPDAATVIYYPGQTIAAMQVRRIKAGAYFARLHPMVPGKYQQANVANANTASPQ
jgi:hypothetical protein